MAVDEDVTGSWGAKRVKVCVKDDNQYIYRWFECSKKRASEEGRKATPSKNTLGSDK